MNHCVAKGFSLIELMVVVAIVGILASVAIPAYTNYTISSANNACLLEAKAYANDTLSRLNNSLLPITPVASGACSSYVGAGATLTMLGSFTATPRSPGVAIITCDLASGGACSY
ncbi:prepilin-type N-terminal cleavage/methylation domain-containing protein [Pseudomonas sp. BLCC-B13]|uniref:pilin n=1 Tax=Pseudomonas sp. BLCC-B13 TaxID=3025314 RepID=UPI00234E7359|nr:prepilin-type N-terminal cleavage/methylation domain-containing protein [Pseudomonas sp. BLCC-B13]MDC7823707.1 prepilin-type N-terminal cleavage/methylation domain-containing protein [Pseudomonas sp. BLCC-B13]